MQDCTGTTHQILLGCLSGSSLAGWQGDHELMLAYQRRALLVLKEMAAEEPDYREYYLRLARGHAENWGVTLEGVPLA